MTAPHDGARGDKRKAAAMSACHCPVCGNSCVTQHAEAVEAALMERVLSDPETVEFVIRWLYNGPRGEQGPPPPREAMADLSVDAANAVDAILFRFRAALGDPR